ncbi:lipopolysaccharide transport periplasmic protein LptA [Geothermobacter hydrogeniphilus]|uniref:Lipopolysaccharide transport periplasmic protein LptA n=1 Tax=Geothermobacter hydrogeniphilus TaxID=1969733 RepID=A0A1X0Y370_9BACT|nr:lipopolysaccharide transport periplasmic protein LptA [Geothermobacter hydrogeniphilus]ORJ59548.1 lipopolysaccharide transport periplasmic protein LptA [Geothermobacter hydrogeniphilus]
MKTYLLLIFLCLFSGAVRAASVAPGDAPLEITSRQLEADDAAGTVTFIGDVEARQADLVIHAGRLTVYYRGEARQVERIEAEQDVRVIQGQRVATGQHALYQRSSGKLVLTGNPRINDGADQVSGDKITVYLNDKRSVVDSRGEGRVKATFHPRGKQSDADAAR